MGAKKEPVRCPDKCEEGETIELGNCVAVPLEEREVFFSHDLQHTHSSSGMGMGLGRTEHMSHRAQSS